MDPSPDKIGKQPTRCSLIAKNAMNGEVDFRFYFLTLIRGQHIVVVVHKSAFGYVF
jgi:hypothetical protein